MKQVEAMAVVTFGIGNVLALSDRQAVARKSLLTLNDDGTFTTTGEVQFKAGEKFGVKGNIPKSLLSSMHVDGKPGQPVLETAKRQGPVKFLMPPATDTPAQIIDREKRKLARGR